MTQSRSRIWSLLERAGSPHVGGVLLVIVAAASVAGTVILQETLPGGSAEAIERTYGLGAWRVLEALGLTDVFHALWYQALLGLVALSVLCATITRFALRREKVAFVLAHAGVLLVLAGGLVYFLRGEKGFVMLREGEASGQYQSVRVPQTRPLPFTVRLDRFTIEHYPATMVFVGPNGEAVSVKPEAGREVTLPWDARRIRFERRIADARRVVEVLPGPTAEPEPAAHFTLLTAEQDVDLWRFARHHDVSDAVVKMDGRIVVTFSSGESPGEAPLPTQPTLFVINHLTDGVVEVPAEAGRVFRIPDVTPASAGEILQVLDDADNTPMGPGLRIQIESGEGVSWRHVFAKFPDQGEVAFIYYRPRLVLEVTEKPGPVYQLRWREKGTWRERPMTPREPVEAGPVKLTLLEVLPSAHLQTRYEDAGQPTGLEAVLIDVSTPTGGSTRFWMSTVVDRTVRLDDRLTLGYLASPDVREYRSELTIDDLGGAPESCVLGVNHPVRRGGWEIFQEGYESDGVRLASRLAVVRDPGLTAVLVGLATLAAGVFFACFIAPATTRGEDRP